MVDEKELSGCCQDDQSCAQEETVKQCCKDLNDYKERYLYLNAEFDNYKKRMDRERTQWIASTQSALLADVLPILDDFERALHQLQSQQVPEEAKTHLMGIELIAKSLQKLLKKYDVQEISDVSVFNPEYHEAIMQVKAENKATGDIVAVLQKGYTLKGQVLRPSQVSVAE